MYLREKVMPTTTEVVHIRIEKRVKSQATKALSAIVSQYRTP